MIALRIRTTTPEEQQQAWFCSADESVLPDWKLPLWKLGDAPDIIAEFPPCLGLRTIWDLYMSVGESRGAITKYALRIHEKSRRLVRVPSHLLLHWMYFFGVLPHAAQAEMSHVHRNGKPPERSIDAILFCRPAAPLAKWPLVSALDTISVGSVQRCMRSVSDALGKPFLQHDRSWKQFAALCARISSHGKHREHTPPFATSRTWPFSPAVPDVRGTTFLRPECPGVWMDALSKSGGGAPMPAETHKGPERARNVFALPQRPPKHHIWKWKSQFLMVAAHGNWVDFVQRDGKQLAVTSMSPVASEAPVFSELKDVHCPPLLTHPIQPPWECVSFHLPLLSVPLKGWMKAKRQAVVPEAVVNGMIQLVQTAEVPLFLGMDRWWCSMNTSKLTFAGSERLPNTPLDVLRAAFHCVAADPISFLEEHLFQWCGWKVLKAKGWEAKGSTPTEAARQQNSPTSSSPTQLQASFAVACVRRWVQAKTDQITHLGLFVATHAPPIERFSRFEVTRLIRKARTERGGISVHCAWWHRKSWAMCYAFLSTVFLKLAEHVQWVRIERIFLFPSGEHNDHAIWFVPGMLGDSSPPFPTSSSGNPSPTSTSGKSPPTNMNGKPSPTRALKLQPFPTRFANAFDPPIRQHLFVDDELYFGTPLPPEAQTIGKRRPAPLDTQNNS